LSKQLFPSLNKVVFLDDDVVVQHDLSSLWDIDLAGKVNGAVETCRGGDSWVMSKRFRNYFNFSHPLIATNFDPLECAWAYGMNIFDLAAWRKTTIKDKYHHWVKEVKHIYITIFVLICTPTVIYILPPSMSYICLNLDVYIHY
jgi:alpha-1,4-galacturonosyltransferase